MLSEMFDMFVQSFWETLIMVGISGAVGALVGLPLGVLLYLTDRQGVLQNLAVNRVLGGIVNAVRSTPFIILLVAVIPFTRLVTGSSIGTAAAVVPLTLAAAPFIARLVETALREVDRGLIEAAQSMGATTSQIVFKVLLPESLPGVVAGLTITFVSLVGYSAMAGAIGGGGLGDLGIRYGYQRYLPEVMWTVVAILIVFVQIVQSFGGFDVGTARTGQFERQRDVVEHRARRQQVEVLEDHADLAACLAQRTGRQQHQVAPADDDIAFGRPREQVDGAHERALAGAASADDAEHLALRDRQVDIAQRIDPAARAGETLREIA